jgi:hypothetical protein
MKTKLRLAVDFDDTIADTSGSLESFYLLPKKNCKEALEKLSQDYEIVIYSCRSNLTNPTRMAEITEMKKFLKEHQIPYDSIDLGYEGKILADAYIDNRAVAFEDNWDELAEALTGIS